MPIVGRKWCFAIVKRAGIRQRAKHLKAHIQHPFTIFVHTTDIAHTLNQLDQVQSYEQNSEINKHIKQITLAIQ